MNRPSTEPADRLPVPGRLSRAGGVRRIALLAALCTLAPLGNLLHLPLNVPQLPDAALVLGSLPAMLAAAWLGPLAAMAVAAVGAATALVAAPPVWGHPLVPLLLIAEAGAVGGLRRRHPRGGRPPALALAAGLYWLALGIPLSLLLAKLGAGTPWSKAIPGALALAANGVLMAALADAVAGGAGLVARRLDGTRRRRLEQEGQRAAASLQAEALKALLERPDDLPGMATRLCALVEERLPGRWCAVVTRDGDDRLAVLAAPSLAPERVRALEALLAESAQVRDCCAGAGHGAGAGSGALAPAPLACPAPSRPGIDPPAPAEAPGTAAFRCQSIPGPEGRTLGLLALVSPQPRPPDPLESQLLELAAGLAAIALETTEVRAQKHLLASLVDQSPAGIAIARIEGQRLPLVYANQALAELTGHSLERILARDGDIEGLPGLGEQANDPLWHALRGGVPSTLEVQARRADGRPYWSALTLVPLHNRAGAVTHVAAVQQDATGRRRAEEALRARQDLHEEAQRVARIGHLDYDLRSGRAAWSPEIYRIFELPPGSEALTFEAALARVHPDDRERAALVYRTSPQGEPLADSDHRLRFDDGRVKYVHMRLAVHRDAAGDPLRTVGTIQDVTDRRLAELAAAERERELHSILELLPNPVFVKDACTRRYLWVNRAFGGLVGREAADLLGKDDFAVFPAAQAQSFADRDARALGTGSVVDIAAEPLDTPAGTRLLHTREVLVAGADGRPHILLGVSEDISEQRRAEAERDAAARALGRYAGELKAFSDLMAAYRPPHEQIRALLEFGCRILGAESAALGEIQEGRYRMLTALGERPVALGPGETVAMGSGQLEALDSLDALLGPTLIGPRWNGASPGEPRPPELPPGSGMLTAAVLHWSDADGHDHTGALSFAPGPGADPVEGERRQIVALVGQRIASSLRERAVLDGLLAARQKEVVGHLASGVAHDFNNLIGVVDLNLDYLTELLPQTGLDPEVREILDETRLATRHAQVVTAGMLSLSRRQTAPPRPVDLSGVVERFIHGLGRLLPPDIAVATWIEPQVSGLADPALLQSALLNLVINARDAMAGQGRLEVGLARVSLPAPCTLALGALEAGDYAALTVTDSGSGMPPEVLARIFQPLFSTKAQGRGTGLGLFMVRELALRWGGGVDVDSKPGHGSRFRLYLPATAEALPATPEPERQPPLALSAGAPERVLVVDDDSSMRLILGHLLEYHGFRVDEAPDGAQALALLDSGTPCDLVLSDIVMPNMDGIELHRRLARAYPRLPVILMTADEHQSVDAAGLPVGTEILFKPLAHRLLLAKIQERLPGRR